MGISKRMDERQTKRLTGRELHALFDELFPHGFAGADVLAEIAPEGWEHSPILACFHPSVEQLFEERVTIHRNLEGWRRLARRREDKHGGRSAARTNARRRAPRVRTVAGRSGRGSHRAGRIVSVGCLFGQSRRHCRGRTPGRHRVISRRRCVPGRAPHARPGGLGETATTCGSIWERSGFPDAPT